MVGKVRVYRQEYDGKDESPMSRPLIGYPNKNWNEVP